MSLTDQQIADMAYQAHKNGAPDSEIETFVRQQKSGQTQGAAPQPAQPSQGQFGQGGAMGMALDVAKAGALTAPGVLSDMKQGMPNAQPVDQKASDQQNFNQEKQFSSLGTASEGDAMKFHTMNPEDKQKTLGGLGDQTNPVSTDFGAGDIGQGAAKGAASAAMGIGELGARGLDLAAKGIAGAPPTNEQNMGTNLQGLKNPLSGYQSPDFNQMTQTKEDLTKTANPVQDVGKIGEQLAEFLAPIGEAAKAGKLTEGAIDAMKVPEWIKSGLKLTAKSGAEGAAAGAVTAAQEGDVNKNAGTNALLGAAMPVGGALASKLAEPVMGALDKMGLQQISKLIKPSAKSYLFGKDPAQAIIDEKITANTFNDLVDKISAKKDEIGQSIADNVKNATTSTPASINAGNIIKRNVTDFGKSITDPAAYKAFTDRIKQLVGEFKPDAASGELQQTSSKLLDGLNQSQLWDLQKKVGSLTQWTGAAYDKEVNQGLHTLYTDLGKTLEKEAPGTKALQQRYANILGADKSATARQAVVERNTNHLTSGVGALTGATAAGLSGHNDLAHEGIAGLVGAIAPMIGNSAAFRTRLAQFLTNEGVDSAAYKFLGNAGKVAGAAAKSAVSKSK